MKVVFSLLPILSGINSKFIVTASTVQTSKISEKFNSSSENSVTPNVTVQRPPPVPTPVAPAINPAITSRSNHIPDPCDVDLPPSSLHLLAPTKTVARKSNSLKH